MPDASRSPRRMAQRYAAADGVAAVLLAGSVARGLADARSDVEVDVYWRRAPSDAERRAVVDDAGWEWVYAEVDEHEWADGVRLDGVKVDVSQFVTATIDGYLDALREGDTEPELQVRATALLDGRALAGDEPDRGLAGPAGAVPRGARPRDARPGAAAPTRRAARDAGRARRPRAADARRGRGRARRARRVVRRQPQVRPAPVPQVARVRVRAAGPGAAGPRGAGSGGCSPSRARACPTWCG